MMAKSPPKNVSGQRGGMLALFGGGMSKKRWEAANLADAETITQASSFAYGAPSTTIATLLGSTGGARNRPQIYQDWIDMSRDAICSSAVKLLTTTAMGGHETSGDIVFIEKKPDIAHNKQACAFVDELAKSLGPLLNRAIYAQAYTAATFGDSYARLYTNARGVVGLYSDETMHPSLVQPYEKGGKTVGYAVYVGEKNFERLNIAQMARFKMPRIQFIPQYGIVEKAIRAVLAEDKMDRLPIVPSMAGGSLLYPAEKAYNNFNNTMFGLVAQRMNVSLDHRIVGLQMGGMTKAQQDAFGDSVVAMFNKVKAVVADAVQTGKPIVETIVSILPMFSEKQLVNLSQGNTTAQTISVDDVFFHARLLAAAFGTDLSNLGFSDQVSGWMGDGGLARTSAQSAENSRIIRIGAYDFCNDVIDIHCLTRYGKVFHESERPWQVNFYGSIAALEAEKQKAQSDKMGATLTIVQTMQMFKDMGATAEMMESMLSKNMGMEEAQAKLFAQIVNAVPPEQTGQGL
ncbi:hypothetical protein [Methylovulum psychrotolerans]|nr:hypothetical protein [Methylovulum psychrotolerans]